MTVFPIIIMDLNFQHMTKYKAITVHAQQPTSRAGGTIIVIKLIYLAILQQMAMANGGMDHHLISFIKMQKCI